MSSEPLDPKTEELWRAHQKAEAEKVTLREAVEFLATQEEIAYFVSPTDMALAERIANHQNQKPNETTTDRSNQY